MLTETRLMRPAKNPVRIQHLVQDIAQAIAGATLGEVFATVNRLVAETLGARHICIHLLDPTGISKDILARAVGTCPILEARPEDMRTFMRAERDWNQHAAQATDHVAQWSNWRALIESSQQFMQGFAFNDGIAVPLCYGDKAYGVFNIYLTGTLLIGHEELDSLLLLGPLLYGAIRRELHILEIESLSQQLAEASRHKSEFLANMSHEVRTPLNSIIGFAELLLEQTVGPLNGKQARYLGNVASSGRHLLQLISDILDISKVEAGKFVLLPEPLPVGSTLEDILVIGRGLANKKGQRIETQIEPDLPPLHADPVRFKQILFNLLSNAVKFTPPQGTITVGARRIPGDSGRGIAGGSGAPPLNLQPTTPNVSLEIRVTDTGVGIKAEDLPRLFQEFTQLETTQAQRHEGTGLGLALTKRLVELHGGQIWAESEGEGLGSTFHIRLPVQPMSLSLA